MRRTQARTAKQAAAAAALQLAMHDAQLRAKERAPAPLRVGGGTKCKQCHGGAPHTGCTCFACKAVCCTALGKRLTDGPSSCRRHDGVR
jgi:hypothetical protein